MLSVLSFDTETFPFSATRRFPPVVCISRHSPDGMRHLDTHADGRLSKAAASVFTHDGIISAHNASYDVCCLYGCLPEIREAIRAKVEACEILCSAILAGEVGVTTKRSLADLCQLYQISAPDKGEDSWRLRYGELYGVELYKWPMEARKYALGDATACWQLTERLLKNASSWQLQSALKKTQTKILKELEKL